MNAVIPRIPARRFGTPDDFGAIADYLMSDASRWHTGDIIYPSGLNSAEDPNFSKNFLEPFKEIFNKKISFFLTLGNHDHKKEPKAFLEIASK